jgi:hypothetical protein
MQKELIPGQISFNLGRTLITSAANSALNLADVTRAMNRHLSGDWGELCPEDIHSNNSAVKNGLRILSAYKDRVGEKFWIITEADRSYTTVMLPSDY